MNRVLNVENPLTLFKRLVKIANGKRGELLKNFKTFHQQSNKTCKQPGKTVSMAGTYHLPYQGKCFGTSPKRWSGKNSAQKRKTKVRGGVASPKSGTATSASSRVTNKRALLVCKICSLG